MVSLDSAGFGQILSEKTEGPFWNKSKVLFCENGLARAQGGQTTAIIDFRTSWAYTENTVHNNSNFSYTYSDYFLSVYGSGQKSCYSMFEMFHKDKNDARLIDQVSEYFRAASGKFIWPKCAATFAEGEYVDCGGLGFSGIIV